MPTYRVLALSLARVALILAPVAVLAQNGAPRSAGVSLQLPGPVDLEAGAALSASVTVANAGDQPIGVSIDCVLRTDPDLYSDPLPDPVYGSNHAAGVRSWLEVDGAVIEDGASTDDKRWTSPGTSRKADHYTESFQYVDLRQVREVTRLMWLSGDANHSWLVDVSASEDGTDFAPVPGLADVDHFQKWGWNDFPLEAPFRARVIRFRHHTDGTKQPIMRFPSELAVYDGVDDETVALPVTGPVVAEGTVTVTVPAGGEATIAVPFQPELEPGAYFLGAEVTGPGVHVLAARSVFVAPPHADGLLGEDARIGLNAANPDLAPRLAEQGVGWVRFENMKWPFVSDGPESYSFTGGIAPWMLDLDAIFEAYHDAGISVLIYMFLVPEWASHPGDGVPDGMRLSQRPEDLSAYGEFCFQVAARYGTKVHPPEDLLTADKRSGLGLITRYEMYNEPNLNPSPDATWGGWAAPTDDYYEMMRYGAEAVKRADPDAVVTSAGYAGMTPQVVDGLRTHVYADGVRPLDLVDVLNVHYYSGHEPPETATGDGPVPPAC